MKQNQKLLITIGLGLLILMNVFVLGWVIIDFFSGPNGPEKTVAATDDWENTTGAEPTEETSVTVALLKVEQELEAIKKPIHSWSVGNGQGEIGYSESASENGPNGFTVEGSDICVLDVVNERILFHYGDGNESYIIASNLHGIYSANGWTATIGFVDSQIEVYNYRREKIADVDLRDSGIKNISEIVSIDDAGVVFEDLSGYGKIIKYRYDWSTGKLEELGKVSRPFYIEIDGNDAIILGEVGDKVYYWYRDGIKNIIGVEVENVGRWYVTQELSDYHSIPSQNLYVSEDGKLYLMECFNNQVVISELMLGEDVDTSENEEKTTEEPTTEEISTELPLPETEQVFAEVRRPIYNRYAGSEERDIGYAESGLTRGPTEFIVEDNIVCILDEVNNRIICCNIEFDSVSYPAVSSVMGLYYNKNGQYALINDNSIIEVYSSYGGGKVKIVNLGDRTKELYANKAGRLYVTRIVSMDDTSVTVEALPKVLYRYDWSTDTLEALGNAPETSKMKVNGQDVTVLGEVGDRVYYQYREGTKNIIGVEVKNVGRWYVTQELSGYHSVPTNNLYVSRDGKLYLMECFEDQMVISELKLGEPEEEPTEESTEDYTKEPTPYDEVLDEYFAKREALYTAAEEPDFDPERWQYIQKRKENLEVTYTDAKVTYKNVEIISETDSEVKLRLYELAKITYVYDGYYGQYTIYDGLPHIIRLSKQDGKYQIQTDSCWDMMTNYQTGLEEDIKLLIPGSDSFAG